ncbi:MAG: hypothetical protein ACE5E7_17870 [Anaerolineae bacterium]
MTTYQEVVEALAAMDEQERLNAILEYWQTIFSEEFITFVQGQVQASRELIFDNPELFDQIFSEMGPDFVKTMKQQAYKNMLEINSVWESMAAVYEQLQGIKAEEESAQRSQTPIPPEIPNTNTATCYQCGAPLAADGLCSSCLAVRQQQEQDDLEYDRQLYDQQQADIEYQRLQDDQLYYDNQYTSYSDDY